MQPSRSVLWSSCPGHRLGQPPARAPRWPSWCQIVKASRVGRRKEIKERVAENRISFPPVRRENQGTDRWRGKTAGTMPLYSVLVCENFPLWMLGTVIGGIGQSRHGSYAGLYTSAPGPLD